MYYVVRVFEVSNKMSNEYIKQSIFSVKFKFYVLFFFWNAMPLISIS